MSMLARPHGAVGSLAPRVPNEEARSSREALLQAALSVHEFPTDPTPEQLRQGLQTPAASVPEVLQQQPHRRVIQASTGWARLELGELWTFRELLFFLTWRDVKVRYKQTALGAAWAILQPFLTMVVFSLFFGKLAKVPSNGLPYPLFSFAGLVAWSFFSGAVSQTANCLVGNANLIKKVYFPRLAMPVSAVLGSLVDFAIALVVLFGMMAVYGVPPTVTMLALPGFVLLAFAAALGTGLWLSALNVQYRDVRYVLSFLIQFWMFATPIAYPSSLLAAKWQFVYALNPMVGVVEGFRWALLGAQPGPGLTLIPSILSAVLLLISGAFYFRRTERHFADVV